MIDQLTVDKILETARIEEVVSDFVSLKRRGASLVACCPFHNEKTPSFYVTPAKGIFKCFGCGKAGSAVGFVMEHEHCTYVEALRYLARKYNIEIVEKEESAEDVILRQKRESLLLVSEFAAGFFRDQLSTPEGRSVGLAYLRKRGLEDATIDKFTLGWAPSGRTTLVDAAVAAGYKLEYILDAGLAVRREDGSVVDKFRERVMFPIHSLSGRVIAFSGRTLKSDNPAKYVNSPETEIYTKSKILLGISFAKAEVSRMDKCILVEGNVDMVTMHQLGITNVVASCGTSLTVDQIRLIHKFTDNVTIMYDGDSAGIHAALRGLGLVLAEGLNVKVVLLPEGEDPDSFARAHTLEEVQRFISEGERDFIAFKTELLLSEAGKDPLRRANLINDIADTIAQIPDPVKRSVYVEDTAVRFGIESGILFQRVSDDRRKPAPARDEAAAPEPQVPVEEEVENRTLAQTERDLLHFLLRYGNEKLEFESDSDYYSGSEEVKPTVTEFIRSALESDGTRLANSRYCRLYDAYMRHYDEGLGSDTIQRALMDSSDRGVAAAAAEVSVDKYRLTVGAFEAALTSTSSWLVAEVPKAILCYNERRIQDALDNLKKELRTANEEETVKILQTMGKYRSAQLKIKKMIGREK